MDPDRFCVRLVPSEIGSHKIHIRFNAVEIPQSPLKFIVCDETYKNSTQSIYLPFAAFVILQNIHFFYLALPIFNSDARKIKYRGLGIQSISLHDKNEFYVDASDAGILPV